MKETHQYNALWQKEQKLIFDLGNLIDNTYTGTFNTTLTATFFTVPDTEPTADLILPISTQSSAEDKGSSFAIPGPVAAVSYTLPRNIERAVVSLSACGQNTEEFWYTNVFSSQIDTFQDTDDTFNGFSPFREVQLLIDGQLAGVSWPFPVIFTGGIVPGLWKPIVGIDAFDLRQHEIDITPWLPLLCNGTEHSFEIRVAGLNDDGKNHATLSESVGQHWVVTGTIFMFSDKPGAITTGYAPETKGGISLIQISSNITTDESGDNQTLIYNTDVVREVSVSSMIRTSQGLRPVSWKQNFSYSSSNNISSQGSTQKTKQTTTGSDTSTSGYANTYKYPLELETTYSEATDGGRQINAEMSRGLTFNVFGPSVFPSGIQNFNITSPSVVSIPGQASQGIRLPGQVSQGIMLPDSLPLFGGALMSTTQTGVAQYTASGGNNSGTTTQDFDFKGLELSNPNITFGLYHRHVKAIDREVTEDQQVLAGRTIGNAVSKPSIQQHANYKGAQPKLSVPYPSPATGDDFSVRALLGRGPGQPKRGLLEAGSSSNIPASAE